MREATAGEVVYLTRNGMPVAAVVSAEAAEYLEALEDAADVIAARRALAEQGPSIPAEQVWAELGLSDDSRPTVNTRWNSGRPRFDRYANSPRT